MHIFEDKFMLCRSLLHARGIGSSFAEKVRVPWLPTRWSLRFQQLFKSFQISEEDDEAFGVDSFGRGSHKAWVLCQTRTLGVIHRS